ncbi:MAG: chemotaxis response regulator protein-glutamate methylesterase [Thermotaleaceae bacterium]
MDIKRKIKVLIVDDSLIFREALAKGISKDPMLEVVAKARDPFDARDQLLAFDPDVMICDVEMPKMDGIEFIRRLLPQYSIPIIVISAMSETVFDAMNAGAVDFVNKPDVHSFKNLELFIQELIAKIKIAAHANVEKKNPIQEKSCIETSGMDRSKIIGIGASTGGTEAIYQVLKQLPATTPGIVIVQHIPPVFSRMFAERLNHQTQLQVKEAQTGDYVEPGKAIVAPGDQHIKIKRIGDRYRVECFAGEKVNGHCPSVDVLFDSLAKEAGSNSIGIILTGMGYDGAKGLLAMKRKGARTIGQDQKTCVVYGMPKVAFDIGAVEKQVSLSNIPQVLQGLLRK